MSSWNLVIQAWLGFATEWVRIYMSRPVSILVPLNRKPPEATPDEPDGGVRVSYWFRNYYFMFIALYLFYYLLSAHNDDDVRRMFPQESQNRRTSSPQDRGDDVDECGGSTECDDILGYSWNMDRQRRIIMCSDGSYYLCLPESRTVPSRWTTTGIPHW